MVAFVLAVIFGYLIGSIPFGLVLTRLAGLGDIRKIGSGNIGATNVCRTGHYGLALLTLLCDLGKAALIAIIFQKIYHSEAVGLVAGTAAVLGHNFPVWLHFKGGKGVASTLGLMLVITPWVGVGACLTWLTIFLIFHYSSLSALIALCLAPLYAGLWTTPTATGCYVLLALLSIWRHRGNIQRLINGQETKITFKRKK